MAADSEGSCDSVTDSDEEREKAKDRFYELVNKKGELHMFSQLVTLRVDYSSLLLVTKPEDQKLNEGWSTS